MYSAHSFLLVYFPIPILFPIKAYQSLTIINNSFDMHRPLPDALDVVECITGIVKLQINALMAMAQIQLTAVIIIRILNIQKSESKLGHDEG